jgi:hypothetical protein
MRAFGPSRKGTTKPRMSDREGESGESLGPEVCVSRCRFCGEEVEWRQHIPYSGQNDHREVCAGMVNYSRQKIREANHESRVRAFLRSKQKRGQP